MGGITALYIDLSIVALSIIAGTYRYRRLDIAGKLILLLLCAIFIDEIVAHIYAVKYHNNMQVYNVYSIVEFSIMSLYFNYSIDFFRQKKLGYYIVAIGLVFAIINYCFIQNINTFNSYYMFFEGFAIVTLALIAFYRLLMYNEDFKLSAYYHFWFTAVFLFFWSITFLSWGMFPLFNDREIIKIIILFIWFANIITYGSIGLIFQLYPRKRLSHE
jgi:hypothetical protein